MALTKVKASNITLTTPAASSNDTSPATTAYVTTALANLADSAPSTLNTLNELAAALGDDANFSTTVTNSIATKSPLASPTFTGNINGGDGVELRLGDSNDIVFKHHASGYGHLENKTGTLYMDSETFTVRTDIGSLGTALYIDHNQRVGIGTATNNKIFNVADPAQGGETVKLHFEASSADDNWEIYGYDRTNSHYTNLSLGEKAIYIQGSDKKVFLGKSTGTPSGDGLLQILGGSSGSGNFPALTLQHHNTTTTNDGPSLEFEGRYNSNPWNMGRIKVYNRGSNFGAKMDFDIHPSDGNQNPTLETAMTITGAAGDGGQVSINRAADGVSSLTVGSTNNTSGQELVSIHHTATSGLVYFMSFMTETNGVDRGYITYNNSGNVFGFTEASDLDLKENVRDLTDGLGFLSQIKPRVFDWKEEGKGQDQVGFIAQEVEEVNPDWVGEKDGTKMIPVNLPGTIPYLIKAVQELKAENDSLKARIETLEG